MIHHRRAAIAIIGMLAAPCFADAQQADSALLTVDRIYGSSELTPRRFGPSRWLGTGASYTTVEAGAEGQGKDIVGYDVETGRREVLVTGRQLIPAGDSISLSIDDYAWSGDLRKLLIFTNSKPVWRLNTRGDYWVLDRTSGRLHQLGGAAALASSLMFAKFSPEGRRVGYVRENNLYVEDLETGAITPLTADGSRTLINGTFDWVYEEELMKSDADGWRWSPDGRSIAFWQLDAARVRTFMLINNTDSLYSRVIPVQYPKVGQENSAARLGVVGAEGGPIRWLRIEGDPQEHYLARMDWAASSDELLVQRLNRAQNTAEVMLADARTGAVRTVLVERDSAWVSPVDDLVWLEGGKRFTWVSERDGWTHVYLVSRDGSAIRRVTTGAFDVLKVEGVDAKGGWLYYTASPENPAQRYLFRVRLDGKGAPQRLSPSTEPGTHTYSPSPDFRYAIESYSRLQSPPLVRLIRLPRHAVIRTLLDNQALREKLGALHLGSVEWFSVSAEDGTMMPAVLMKPADFDSTRTYPLLFNVYGGPGHAEVVDGWGGRYLWHAMLTQKGYLVAIVDNRGAPAPLGRRWRKAVYGQLGVLETQDQAAAARALSLRPYVDPGRVAIWGWSYGGFMALNALFRHPDLYRAGVAVAPVTHWSLYDNVYTERYNGLLGENREGYDRGSPLSYVDSLRGALLLVHGSGDDNVHYQMSEVLINALVAANKPFAMMEYPDRTHCICQGASTQAHLFALITRFLDENLLARRPASEPSTDRGAATR